MYFVYILYSPAFQKIYIGYTSDIDERLKSHNIFAKKGWTLKYRPWVVIYTEETDTKEEALKREKYLKSGVGRELIHNKILPKFLKTV